MGKVIGKSRNRLTEQGNYIFSAHKVANFSVENKNILLSGIIGYLEQSRLDVSAALSGFSVQVDKNTAKKIEAAKTAVNLLDVSAVNLFIGGEIEKFNRSVETVNGGIFYKNIGCEALGILGIGENAENAEKIAAFVIPSFGEKSLEALQALQKTLAIEVIYHVCSVPIDFPHLRENKNRKRAENAEHRQVLKSNSEIPAFSCSDLPKLLMLLQKAKKTGASEAEQDKIRKAINTARGSAVTKTA